MNSTLNYEERGIPLKIPTLFIVLIVILYILMVVCIALSTYSVTRKEKGVTPPEKTEDTSEVHTLISYRSEGTISMPLFLDKTIPIYQPSFIFGDLLNYNLEKSELIGENPVPYGRPAYLVYWEPKDGQVLSSMHEYYNLLKDKDSANWGLSYGGFSKAFFRPLKKTEVTQYNTALSVVFVYATAVERMSDAKPFWFINLSSDIYKFDLNFKYAYSILYAVLRELRVKYTGDFIICGTFGVHGHEAVFTKAFAGIDIHICNFDAMPTLTSKDSVGSPEGLVVTKGLYERVEYKTEFLNSDSQDGHLVVVAKLYTKSTKKGVEDSTRLTKYWTTLASDLALEDPKNVPTVYYKTGSKFDPIKDINDTVTATKLTFPSDGPMIASAYPPSSESANTLRSVKPKNKESHKYNIHKTSQENTSRENTRAMIKNNYATNTNDEISDDDVESDINNEV